MKTKVKKVKKVKTASKVRKVKANQPSISDRSSRSFRLTVSRGIRSNKELAEWEALRKRLEEHGEVGVIFREKYAGYNPATVTYQVTYPSQIPADESVKIAKQFEKDGKVTVDTRWLAASMYFEEIDP